MKSIVFVLALTFMLVVTDNALAHRPYFTQIEPIVLPNGQPGEMRLLYGDGVFLADPARILVLDGNRQLLARSHQSTSMSLLCNSEPRSCWGYDGAQVLILDAVSFRSGDVVPGLDRAQRDGLWKFEAGEESWGFAVRDASIIETIRGQGVMARQRLGSLAILSVFGAIAVLLIVVGKTRPVSRSWLSRGRWAGGILLRLMTVVVILPTALYVMAFAGLTDALFLLSLGNGAGVVLLARWVWKRRRATASSVA